MSRQSKQELIGRLIHEWRAAAAANDAFDECAFAVLGINTTDGRCLDIIENQGPMTAGRLAELSGLTTAAVTTVLDRLEKVGYARRTRDESDRRRVMVELTPEFGEKARQIWEPLGRDSFKAFDRMTAEQLETAIEMFKTGRELNERHTARMRNRSG